MKRSPFGPLLLSGLSALVLAAGSCGAPQRQVGGLSAGIAIAARVKAQGASARDAYLGMLRAGTAKPPLELLRGAGVDLTRPDAIAAAAKVMDETLGRMEEILARRAAGKSRSRRTSR